MAMLLVTLIKVTGVSDFKFAAWRANRYSALTLVSYHQYQNILSADSCAVNIAGNQVNKQNRSTIPGYLCLRFSSFESAMQRS